MILVDTSIWIDHFHSTEAQLAALLERGGVLMHPCVIGEIALGSIKKRSQIIRDLGNLPASLVATHEEVMVFIERHSLANSGIGYVDTCLLASAALTPDAALWSRDKSLRAAAIKSGVAPRIKLN